MIKTLKAAYGRLNRLYLGLKPPQALTLGFLSYVAAGAALLSFPFSRTAAVRLIDNVFNVVSAISITGLTTISVADNYTFFGQLVFVALFQLGGIGYMTVSSFIILARGKELSTVRLGILKAGFTLPQGFEIKLFVKQIIIFSAIIETAGTLLLWLEFRAAGVDNAFWSALFHCVSAFATAGFSLNNDSLVAFADNTVVNITIGTLCYIGAIGFIVLQDAWLSVRFRSAHKITLTSKIILLVTFIIFAAGTPFLFFGEPSIQPLPIYDRFLACAFQIMTASSTAGFNTISIADLSHASLAILILAMLIGASPSGTGGGIKTTSVSSLYSILASVVRGKTTVTFWKHEIPVVRLYTAVASTTLYMSILGLGIYALCLTQKFDLLEIFFETSSALGTVGLSLEITGNLNDSGKIILTLLMFIGRVGPLTLGLSMFHKPIEEKFGKKSDLAV
jgi:trk system potassium uptake protein TrkH